MRSKPDNLDYIGETIWMPFKVDKSFPSRIALIILRLSFIILINGFTGDFSVLLLTVFNILRDIRLKFNLF